MISDDLRTLFRQYRVTPPAEGDVEDVRRALIQLRNLLLIDYKHEAAIGDFREYAAREGSSEDVEYRLGILNELARPNTRGRRGKRKKSQTKGGSSRRRSRARRNPLSPESARDAAEYVRDGRLTPALGAALGQAQQSGDWRTQQVTKGVLESIFPDEGKLRPDSWSPEERFPQSLTQYDLVNRAGALTTPAPATQEPFSDRKALDYIVESAGLSLSEAGRLLDVLKASVDRKGPKGDRRSMQVSSALCKLGRARKLPYKPPADLLAKTGFNSVLILLSPRGQAPRVMTWRHQTHLDCDLIGTEDSQLLGLVGQALQATLYWLAERPKRLVKTRVYVGRVGESAARLAWASGMPLSLATLQTNLAKPPELVYSGGGTPDVTAYVRALRDTFGTTTPQPRATRTRPSPSRTAPEPAVSPPPDDIFEEPPVDEEVPAETTFTF